MWNPRKTQDKYFKIPRPRVSGLNEKEGSGKAIIAKFSLESFVKLRYINIRQKLIRN